MPDLRRHTRAPDEYPLWIGMIFVFNLIVGTGALTLPALFSSAGWLLSPFIVILLGFVSFMTLTFIIETMSCANAIMHYRQLHVQRARAHGADEEDQSGLTLTDDGSPVEEMVVGRNEQMPLVVGRSNEYYTLNQQFELGVLATLFFSKIGIVCFYLCMCIYLYGDLSIYNASIAKSVTDIICGNATAVTNASLWYMDEEQPDCWPGVQKMTLYRINQVIFVLLVGPFVFFNVSKTKYIQITTGVFRWLAFTSMIIIASSRFFNGKADGHPPMANFNEMPNLFGAAIYSFMCHHSIPALTAPIRDKTRLKVAFSLDYIGIAVFYLLLCYTGSFAFKDLRDLYTLNFIPDNSDGAGFTMYKLVEYFLGLLPVLTISASYPIIAITLRNNLQILFLDMSRIESYHFCVRHLVFPLLAIVPPLLVTLCTESVDSLVQFTGSYAGSGIQYIIPIALIYSARKRCSHIFGGISNRFQSPFRSILWLVFVLLWSIICMILVTWKNINGMVA